MQQIVFLDRYADLRGDRATEIMTQMGGAVAYLGSIAYLSPSRTPYTLELLAAAIRLANYVEQRFKHALACRRPIEYSPQVQPIILTPGHGSFPSGHATETFISALVLLRLLQASPVPPYNVPADQQRYASQLMQLASRVAINRTVAGVHFPVDSSAGELLGLTLGQYFVNRCTGAANYDAYAFDGTVYPWGFPSPNDGDFYWTAQFAGLNQTPAPPFATLLGAQMGVLAPASDLILQWLWGQALAEWG
jgi:hypothetical protein